MRPTITAHKTRASWLQALACSGVSLLLLLTLASCGTQSTQANQQNSGETTTTEMSTASPGASGSELEAASYGMDFEYSKRDADASYDEAAATKITLADSGSQVQGAGASADGSTVTIDAEGTYVVSGTLANGSLCVNAPDTAKVQVVFDGVDIHNETGAAFLVEEADKVFVTLADGSTNTLSDGATHDTAADESDHDGAVFSHSDLTFNGSGALTVNAQYANGIVSKDDLVMTDGTYKVEATGDALQGKDCVKIADGDFSLTAGDDGIVSNNAEDATRGFVSIDGGTFKIESHNDGIQAETVLRVFGGQFDITTDGGATGNITTGEEFMGRGMMGQGGQAPGGQAPSIASTQPDQATTTETTDTESVKGIKAGTLVEIDGATFTIDSLDDSVHSNGHVSLVSGDLTLTSDDDGMHADGILNIAGGTTKVVNSNEGLEGAQVYIKGGDINIVAVDDGINAASDTARDILLQIEGGTLYIEAGADGLDSNGDINVTGGSTTVFSTNSGIETAIDVDQGSVLISGGTVVAGGPWSNMASTFSSDSDQASFVYQAASTIAAGTTMRLVDDAGNELMTFEVAKASQSLIISHPDLEVGKTYALYAGDTKLVEFTQNNTAISVSSSGQTSEVTTGGMGAPGGMGGAGDPGAMGDMGGAGGGRPDRNAGTTA